MQSHKLKELGGKGYGGRDRGQVIGRIGDCHTTNKPDDRRKRRVDASLSRRGAKELAGDLKRPKYPLRTLLSPPPLAVEQKDQV